MAESLASLKRDDLVAFHGRRYLARQALLAVVGDVQPADAFARTRRNFAGWPAGEPVNVPAVAAQQPRARPRRRILVIACIPTP